MLSGTQAWVVLVALVVCNPGVERSENCAVRRCLVHVLLLGLPHLLEPCLREQWPLSGAHQEDPLQDDLPPAHGLTGQFPVIPSSVERVSEPCSSALHGAHEVEAGSKARAPLIQIEA